MKKIKQRSLAVVLMVALLTSTLGIFDIGAAQKIRIENWPAIMGFTSGTAPEIDGWEFNIKDYGEKAAMQVSDKEFKAPVAEWDADNGVPSFSWSEVDGAVGYEINIYKGVTLVKTYSATSNSFTAVQSTTIPAGEDYEVQVIAYGNDNNVISASCVRKFTAEAKQKYDYVIEDFNNPASAKVYAVRNNKLTYAIENGSANITVNDNSNAIYFQFPYATEKAFKDNTGNASYIYVKMKTAPGFGSKTKAGFSTSQTNGKTSVADASVTYPKYANIYNVNLPSNKVDWRVVSVDNPTKTASVTMTSNIMGGYVPYEYDSLENGYYYLIPLNAYSGKMQADIKAGTFDIFGLHFETALTYNTATGKYVTASATVPGKVSIDEIGFITDYTAWVTQLQEEYDPEFAESNSTYAFEGDTGVLKADVFDKNKNQLSNSKFTSYYKFQNENSARRLTFAAISSFTNKYGANVTFTATKSGYYDLANKLQVVNNVLIGDATVYYRVVKKASNGNISVVYPFDTSSGEWYSMVVSADNKNPVGKIGAPMVKLNAGEQIIIEAYADIPAGGQLEIDFGNPTVTKVGYSETYKGEAYTWSYGNYVPNFVFDGGVNNNSFHQTGRWTEKFLRIDSTTGAEHYEDFINHIINWGLTGKTSSPAVGFYYYTDTTRTQEMKLQPGTDDYGLAFQFTSPVSGSAVVNYSGNGELKYRIMLNGEKVYPEDDSWKIGTSVSQVVEVVKGDVVSLDFIKSANSGATITCKSPSITMTKGNTANTVGDHTYSPLWERPYNGKDYKGRFTALDGSVWKFESGDFSSATAPKLYTDNYYDSSQKSLSYKNDNGESIPDAKFVFDKEQLKAVIGDKNAGVSLTFTAPTLGYYDFSTALNLLDGTFNATSGAGNLKVRLMARNRVIWPSSGEWFAYNKMKIGNGIDIPACELALNSGDTVVLQIYAASLVNIDGEEVAKPMVIGLGTPAIQHITAKVFTDTGNETIYMPSDFAVMEDGYSGKYIPANSRFNVTFNSKKPDTLNEEKGEMSIGSNKVIYNTKNGKTNLVIAKDTTAAIEFISPMKGNGKYEIKTPAVSGVSYRLLKKGNVLKDWADTLPELTEITADKGDKFTLEVKATSKATVSFDIFNISLKGIHNNPNKAGDAAFYASFAVPYGDDYYKGKYTESDDSYWKFNLYDVNKGVIKQANYYDADNKKKLYNTGMKNVGYYFIDQNNRMEAEIFASDSEKYGLALGFAAPQAGVFNFRSGLQLETNASATFMLRLIQKNAEGAVTTIWPADTDTDGWYEQTITQNEDITIPHAEFTFKQGDTAYLQIYAKDSTAESLTVSLASPGFMKDSPVVIEHADIGLRIYDCKHYNPYQHFDHKGDFTTYNYIPMENRWNLEYISINPEDGELMGIINPDFYRIGTSGAHEVMFKGHDGLLWLNYHSNKTPMGIGRYTANNQNHYQYVGSQKRFIAPSTTKYQLKGVAPSAKEVIDGGSIRYRITKVAATGEEKVIWPSQEAVENNEVNVWRSADGSAWEVLDSENLVSEAKEFEIELQVGDQLKFQAYNYATPTDLDTYIANNPDLAKTKWTPTANVAPQIVLTDYITEKSIHTLNTGWMDNYQLSPYWKIQSCDGEGQPYRDNTRTSWNYWLDTKYSLYGISNMQKWKFQIWTENNWPENIKPIISARFTFSSDGYLSTKGSAAFIGTHFVDEAGKIPAKIKARILLNGKNLYPENGWSTITNGTKFNYDIKGVEVKAGDELRYELRYDNGGKDVMLSWNPSLTINKYKDVYLFTDDIYNMLTSEMTAHFKSLDSTRPFEAYNAAAKALSDAIAARKEAAAEKGPDYLLYVEEEPETEEVYEEEPSEEEIDEDDGDYREWTEEIYTPGGGYRKIRRIYSTEWWVYALIIAGGVVVAAGITVLTVILVKKKRKKSATKI